VLVEVQRWKGKKKEGMGGSRKSNCGKHRVKGGEQGELGKKRNAQ